MFTFSPVPHTPSCTAPSLRALLRAARAGTLLFAAFVAFGCAAETRSPVGEVDPTLSPENAEAELRAAIAASPSDPQPHFLLGQILAEQGRAAESHDQFDRALTLDPGLARKVTKEREHYLRVFQDDAKNRLGEGLYPEAGRELDKADVMVPDHDETLYLRGRLAEAEGWIEAALDYYRRAWQEDQGNDDRERAYVSALVGAGQKHYQSGDYAQALEVLEEAKGVERSADLEYLRGTVAYTWAQNSSEETRPGLLDIAAEAFRAVLDRHPQDDDARFNLGAVLLGSGRFEEAVGIYQSLISRNAEEGDLYLALARAQSLSGQSEAAVTTEAVGRALRTGEPVGDPRAWALRAAERFPNTELAQAYRELFAPESIRTYTLPGGDLVEVWFYWREGLLEAFREGGRLGPTFDVGAD